MKKLALVTMVLSTVLGYGASAFAAEGPYESSTAAVSFTPSNPGPGEAVTVIITGCTPGESLRIVLAGTTIATAACSAASPQGLQRPQQSAGGVATTEISAPTEPGTYRYTVNGSQGYDRSAALVVAAPAVVQPVVDESRIDWTFVLTIVMIGVVGLALAAAVHLRRVGPT